MEAVRKTTKYLRIIRVLAEIRTQHLLWCLSPGTQLYHTTTWVANHVFPFFLSSTIHVYSYAVCTRVVGTASHVELYTVNLFALPDHGCGDALGLYRVPDSHVARVCRINQANSQ